MNRCYNCKFWLTQDFGYSNYTCLSTDVHCLKDHFEPLEESYSWEICSNDPEKDHEFFKQAEKCPDYKEGEGIRLDVDGYTTIEEWKEDEELYNLAKQKGF